MTPGRGRGRKHHGVGPRADGDDLPHARHARRDGRHQERRGQRISAARHVAADAIERPHALLDGDARRHRHPHGPRQLRARDARDVTGRRRGSLPARALGAAAAPAAIASAPISNAPVERVEPCGVAADRRVAFRRARPRRSGRRAVRARDRGRGAARGGARRAPCLSTRMMSIMVTRRSCSAGTRRCPGRRRP